MSQCLGEDHFRHRIIPSRTVMRPKVVSEEIHHGICPTKAGKSSKAGGYLLRKGNIVSQSLRNLSFLTNFCSGGPPREEWLLPRIFLLWELGNPAPLTFRLQYPPINDSWVRYKATHKERIWSHRWPGVGISWAHWGFYISKSLRRVNVTDPAKKIFW